MKKMLSLLLALMLLAALPLSAMAEVITVKSTLLDIMDQSASTWYASNDSRAMLVACVITDLIMSGDDLLYSVTGEAISKDAVFVGRQGNNLLICFWGDRQALICAYNPMSTGIRIEVLTPYMPSDPEQLSTYMESYVVMGTITDYHRVHSDDILIYVDAIIEALGG